MLWITNWNTTMDLANLNAFIAIAETGSFSGAGERLHLTQPAISKRIAGLEQQLKVRLFDRLGREVGLTEAGRALLPRAYQILNVLDDTRRALTNLTGEVSGRLTLATSHHIGLHRLPPTAGSPANTRSGAGYSVPIRKWPTKKFSMAAPKWR
jgi:DNA-binding transcriptional LysR family regulator